MINNDKLVSVHYELYLKGETPETEELIEKTPDEMPLVYLHGHGMMLPAFEAQMEGKQTGDTFDFVIPCAEAYGPHDPDGVMELEKKLFYIDGSFDDDRVYEGAIVPMNTADGQSVLAEVVEVTDKTVTIDLNHPFAGEDLHFKGTIAAEREATPEEIDAFLHPKGCGGCCGGGGNCGDGCNDGCGNEGCEGGCCK